MGQSALIAALLIHRQRRRRAEGALRDSEERYRTLATAGDATVWRQDAVGTLAPISPMIWRGRTGTIANGEGREDGVDSGVWLAAIHPEDRERVRTGWEQAQRRTRPYDDEIRVQNGDSAHRHYHVRVVPLPDPAGGVREWFGMATDITEKRRAEAALRTAQNELAHVNRVASMGEMAASIAHEVNQPLCAIAANANACLRWLESSGARSAPAEVEMREALHDVVQDADRASEVIRRVRGLLKKGAAERGLLDVNAAVGDVLALVRMERERAGIDLEMSLAEGLPSVIADRVQIQQVLLNLAINAIEAMAAQPRQDGQGQVLTVRTRQEKGDALVEVADTGPGLTAEERDRIFQAFYTTKPEGMGMGLAISRSIIEAHGGRLWAAESAAGEGALFRLTLPIAPPVADEEIG
jgi:PAS domain S-box-containing protein